jgi:hypothetical protein
LMVFLEGRCQEDFPPSDRLNVIGRSLG